MKATASCTSKGIVTWPSAVPLSYSFGTRSRKRSSWLARLTCSSGVSGAAVKPSRSASTRSRAASKARCVGGGAGRGEPLEVAVGRRALGGAALLAVLGGDRLPVAAARSPRFRRSGRRSRVRPPGRLRRGWSAAAPGRCRAGPFRSAAPLRAGVISRAGELLRSRSVPSTPGRVKRVVLRKSRICSQVARLRRVAAPRRRRRRPPSRRAAGRRRSARGPPPAPTSSRRSAARLAAASAASTSFSSAGASAARPARSGPRSCAPRRASTVAAAFVEEQLRLRLEELGADLVGRLPGRFGGGRGRWPAEQRKAAAAIRIAPAAFGPRGGAVVPSSGPPPLAFLQFDFELFRRLGHLAGDRLGLGLGLGAERVGLLGGEFLAVGLAVAQVGGEVDQALQLLAWSASPAAGSRRRSSVPSRRR